MHPHRSVTAVDPLDHAFDAAGCHNTGNKLDEVRLGLCRHQVVGTGLIEVLLKRVVLQAQCTGSLVETVFLGEGYGLAPEFFGQSGTLVGLLTSTVKLGFIPNLVIKSICLSDIVFFPLS